MVRTKSLKRSEVKAKMKICKKVNLPCKRAPCHECCKTVVRRRSSGCSCHNRSSDYETNTNFPHLSIELISAFTFIAVNLHDNLISDRKNGSKDFFRLRACLLASSFISYFSPLRFIFLSLSFFDSFLSLLFLLSWFYIAFLHSVFQRFSPSFLFVPHKETVEWNLQSRTIIGRRARALKWCQMFSKVGVFLTLSPFVVVNRETWDLVRWRWTVSIESKPLWGPSRRLPHSNHPLSFPFPLPGGISILLNFP